MLDAEAAGATIPQWAKDEIKNYNLPNHMNNDGSFDYTADGNASVINTNGVGGNVARSGIALQALFLGAAAPADARITSAKNFVNNRWGGSALAGDYTGSCGTGLQNKGCAYAMFNVFKGFKLQGISTVSNVGRAAGPGTIPANDWYADYQDWLTNQGAYSAQSNQSAPTTTTGGQWGMAFSCCAGTAISGSTALAELILSPVALVLPDGDKFSTVGLRPANGTALAGTAHTVIAKAESSNGTPVPAATVTFVVSGANVGNTGSGSATTDSTGEASFTYTGNVPGNDTIQAFIGSLSSNTVSFTWLDRPPVANAGPDGTINADASCSGLITLNGGGSSDPDNDPLTYSWTGPGGFSSTLKNPQVSMPPGTYTFTLTVDDGRGQTSTDSVTIIVKDGTAPILNLPPNATIEQTNRAGTPHTVNATATDSCGGVTLVSDAPLVFPLGNTDVHFTATDTSGNVTTGTVTVKVVDTIAPAITAPAAVTVEQTNRAGTPASVTATATDICAAAPTITSNAPAVFPLGNTTVTFTATDASGNTSTATTTVTVVDTTAPTVTAPAAVTVEQTDRNGTAATLGVATATDICDAAPTITNNAPAVFPLGTTTVTFTATDASGNFSTATTTVTVKDTTAPVINNVPAAISVEQTNRAGTPVTVGLPTATDICDAAPTVTSDAPATFPLGTTTVTFKVTDASGNTSTATTTVTVKDTTAPVLNVPAAKVVEQTNRAGTPVSLTATATDICDASPAVTSNAPAVFPLGTTTVTFTATDASGNTTTGTTTVTVKDTTAPAFSNVPAPIVVEQTNLAGTPVSVPKPTATDICDAAPTVTSNAPATFPLGTTTVTFTTIDASGNTATTTTVTVKDTTKPTITTTLLNPATLWPVNHNMTPIGTIAVSDICDARPGVVLSITQDEPLNTTGDGNFSPDASVTFNGNTANINLRAERSGNSDGRVYLLKTTTTDASGNTAFACSAVTVTKSQSAADKASVANQAAAAVAACNATGATLQFSSTNGPIVGPKQ